MISWNTANASCLFTEIARCPSFTAVNRTQSFSKHAMIHSNLPALLSGVKRSATPYMRRGPSSMKALSSELDV